ncbi:type IV pilin N-terminal domain-containing protein [Methanosarcina sp.]|uniref:type IV pilin N-terminal domain-containing protein n=1 Tax=Methanosarcina sp. TaxID=2213 RepID=UPI002ABBBB60|nr:type IV pilin N-terminal domain-containing protein [Methanosarcina sp.]MDY9926566.1 type IV pilin N-terminal domain-containing protein [Methanosarcina sp.]
MPKIKEFIKNRSAVSDVVGEVLMTTIAVILISSIAVFIFSYDGAADVPRAQVKGWMSEQTDTIYLEHGGGEFIDTEALEIAVNINGDRYNYSSPQIYANLENKRSWELGDTIKVNTFNEWAVNLTNDSEINVYLIDKPSKKVFQNLRLSTGEIADFG